MRIIDYIEQSCANLLRKKLRTFLTIFGVVIGIGALVCMIAFGEGVQKNFRDTFDDLGLFNYIYVFPASSGNRFFNFPMGRGGRVSRQRQASAEPSRALDDPAVRELSQLEFVQWILPDVSFLAEVKFNDNEQSCTVRELPADICQAGFIKLSAGEFYTSDQENSVIISESLLRRLHVSQPEDTIGKDIEIYTLSIDPNFINPVNIVSSLESQDMLFTRKGYTLKIVGVSERAESAGPIRGSSDIFIPKGTSDRMEKLSITSISDLFDITQSGSEGYSTVTVKIVSPKYLESVKSKIEDSGFSTFALAEQLEQMDTLFIFIDMFIFAIGMIAIAVASLGIINTMVMSIMERYKEIGIMEAVGASKKDIKGIFLFESGMIGLLGGVFGLGLGWLASLIINQIINIFASRQGAPYIYFFSFPWWLCLSAIGFSIIVSVIAGIYPTIRAAQVDPVIALRHD